MSTQTTKEAKIKGKAKAVKSVKSFSKPSKTVKTLDKSDPLIFNAFSWHADDGQEDFTYSYPTAEDVEKYEFTVHIFGKTEAGQSVALHVKNFRPTFFLRIHDKPMDMTLYYEISEWMSGLLSAKSSVDFNKQGNPRWHRFGNHLCDDTKKPIVTGKTLWGFTNETQYTYYKFEFKSHWAYRTVLNQLKYNRKGRKIRDRETGQDLIDEQGNPVLDETKRVPEDFGNYQLFDVIDPLLRFAHVKNLHTAGWIQVEGKHRRVPYRKSTRCDLEFDTEYNYVEGLERELICLELLEMAYDIEVYSHDETFPKPEILENVCFQIGVTFKRYKDKEIQEKIVLHYGCPCDPVDGIQIITYPTEAALLMGFRDLILARDPDLIYSWNGDGFDSQYLFKRAEICNIYKQFCDISKINGFPCRIVKQKFSSSAAGDNEYLRIEKLPGRLNLDIMIFVKKDMVKYDSYKLDNIAKEKLKTEEKRHVSPKQIFRWYKARDSARCAEIADYCAQDTTLVQLLVDKIDVVTQLFEMANITYTQVGDLLSRGQSVKVYSQITKAAFEKGFFTPFIEIKDEGKPMGAIVLEPMVGAYREPVSVLDFASLYPTIMMAYNMCYSTLVLDSQFDNLPGVVYDDIEWEDEHKRKIRARFAQGVTSIIPELQRYMFTSRKRVKKMIKDLKVKEWSEEKQAMIEVFSDPLRARVLSGRELAIKVSMNSIYGFTSGFNLRLPLLTGAVTGCGRRMINQTKHFMEKVFPQICVDQGWTKEKPNLTTIGGDTDSVFILFSGFSIMETISLSKKAEVLLTEQVFNREPIAMEYEKVYLPYVLIKKKNYIGMKYSNDDKKSELDYKGIALKRRNYCPYVKTIYQDVIDVVMADIQSGPERAVDVVRQHLLKLENYDLPMKDLVITASLKSPKSYKNDNLPHVQLYKRMKDRDEGSAPTIGDRFGFVIVEDFSRSVELSARSEDPTFAEENNIKFDALFYLNNQVRKPITKFLQILDQGPQVDKVFTTTEALIRWKQDHAVQDGFRKRNNLQDISSFFGGNKSNEGTPKAPVKKDATAVIPARFIPKQKKSVMVQKSKITSFFGTACDD